MGSIQLGVQLYTLRDEMENDFLGTLKKVKEIGYDGVEFAGFGGHTAAEIKKELKALDLKAISSHVPLEQLENNLEQVIEYHREVGINYIACPYLSEEQRGGKDDYLKLAKLFNKVGAATKEAGIQFLYHHHDFEFVTFDGEYALDLIFANTDPDLVQLECDIFWVQFSGLSPAAYIEQYSKRVPLIHLKDLKTEPEKTFAEVGNGVIDMTAVIETGQKAGAAWFIVEQDQCERPPLESVAISYSNIQKL